MPRDCSRGSGRRTEALREDGRHKALCKGRRRAAGGVQSRTAAVDLVVVQGLHGHGGGRREREERRAVEHTDVRAVKVVGEKVLQQGRAVRDIC